MKLSLSWIFDHINADWKTVAVTDLVTRFTTQVAEVGHVDYLRFDFTHYSFVTITHKKDTEIHVHSPEWNSLHILTTRPDVQEGKVYLIYKDELTSIVRWATTKDVGGQKEELLPAWRQHETLLSRAWKTLVELEDYVLEIDNKSINHRPDLWGHRGCAREIAALLGLSLKPLALIEQDLPIARFDNAVSAAPHNPISVQIKDAKACHRFTGVYLTTEQSPASDLFMGFRLARIDLKPLCLFVDLTNYVMLDLGQPLHAYDANTLTSGTIVPRFAKSGESLHLLDGQTIKLDEHDVVITDGQQPIALAGIMGGMSTRITDQTSHVFIEAASFAASTIRHSSLRHKIRTQASTRFEKGLDPEQTEHALLRMIRLLNNLMPLSLPELYVFSIGTPSSCPQVKVTHEFLEKRLGTRLLPAQVIDCLEPLEFKVSYEQGLYTIDVPSFRGTSDIRLPEDILEEVGRCIGYTLLVPQLPKRITKPSNTYELYRLRRLRSYLADALSMHELSSYAFFDEQFLRELSWQPTDTLQVANPLSEQWKRLVTSLVPHLIRAVVLNSTEHDSMKFFECANIWNPALTPYEQLSLAGVFFEKKQPLDFYNIQAQVIALLNALDIRNLTWQQVEAPEQPWFMPYKTTDIMVGSTYLGRFGAIVPSFLHTVTPGDAYIFEFNAQIIKRYKPQSVLYKQPNRYPDVVRDISILVSLDYTAEQIKASIKKTNPYIVSVDLIDAFTKNEWQSKKSLTFRYLISDTTKTITKTEIDVIHDLVIDTLTTMYGAQIR